ncbi:hypothetical protein FisN_14Hu050 [Fistulifera solaris]|jgi:hypothetical protein|uniref:BTB domain-containing protein n=1 Tax=Fistulifera solaris TaxID=1519565 RepID=A0A1Z5K893_FISSO|nr:hypothetical protein FisN_14Hu050 [Fistulifera solaris]|eukprot:GAX22436.1 hypothetical protein FisN_14Hu050 [Fistulifera solaris]
MARRKNKSIAKRAAKKNGNSPPQTSQREGGSPQGDEQKPTVRLNVGGMRYEVARDTLMFYEDSMLASLVSGRWKEGNGEDEIFIDRDGRRFGFLLNYLRSDRVYLSESSDQAALEDEFEYFGIDADMSKGFIEERLCVCERAHSRD